MRRLLVFFVLLLFLTALARLFQGRDNTAPIAAPYAAESSDDDWRRTARGWERRRLWNAEVVREAEPRFPVHPALLGALCLFLSLGALVAFSRRT